MKIIISPIGGTDNLDTLPIVNGDFLTYRGQQYDLAQLPDGGQVEASAPFVGLIKRVNGQVELTLHYRYNSALAEPDQPKDISAYTFIVENGQCPDPIVYKPEPVVEPVIEPELDPVVELEAEPEA